MAATLILVGGQFFSGTFDVPNAFAGAGAVEGRDSKFGLHPKRMIALICIYLAGLTLAVRFGTFDGVQGFATSAFAILFLGVFPLFNILADFASIGLTRFLLRQGIQCMSRWKAIVDLLAGPSFSCASALP